jgi:hypothetical protein
MTSAPELPRPHIQKLGTIDLDMVETTPIVFRRRLYRYEYVREKYHGNQTGTSYSRFIDVASGRATPACAAGYHLGSALVTDGAVYVFAVEAWGGSTVRIFRSPDLETWEAHDGVRLPGWGLYNNSVCRGRGGDYVMALEAGEPPEVVGVRFTIVFLRSPDLRHWSLLPLAEHTFGTDRYTACPALRYVGGYYYLIYLEERSGPSYVPFITRSADLKQWETSPYNPVMTFSEEDRRIANEVLPSEQRQRIAEAINLNNSDIDLCQFRKKTVLYYSWGDQQGTEFLAEAAYEGPLVDFLRGFFPDPAP